MAYTRQRGAAANRSLVFHRNGEMEASVLLNSNADGGSDAGRHQPPFDSPLPIVRQLLAPMAVAVVDDNLMHALDCTKHSIRTKQKWKERKKKVINENS